MDDSFASAEEYQSKIRNNLFNEIQTENTTHWKNDEFEFSLDRSHNQQINQSRGSLSFDTDLPVQSKIKEPLRLGLILQTEQHEETGQLEEKQPHQVGQQDEVSQKHGVKQKDEVRQLGDEKGQQKQEKAQDLLELPQGVKGLPSSVSSNGNQMSQVTIVIHEQSLASKIYEQIDTEDASNFSMSLRSFLSLNDKNYRPHVKCLKFLYCKLKDYGRCSLQNVKNYINFTEVKLKQQIESLRFLDSLEASREDQNTQNLNMDERIILQQIRSQNITRREKRKAFYRAIQTYYQRLLQCWRKIKERREKRERYIEECIIRVIDRIELEMEDMIICRLQNEKHHLDNHYVSQKIRSPNPFLLTDKYLEMKYLMQREHVYLQLITDFNGKIITYMVSMFSRQEVETARNIKETLIDYAISYMECYGADNEVLNMKVDCLEDSHCEDQVRHELAEHLLGIIPIELYNIAERNNKLKYPDHEKLEVLLTDFSHSLQNTIFLSTIEMNNDFILFRNEALWKTTSSVLQKEQSSILYESKAESKQALAVSKAHDSHLQKNMRVVVVLTSNYHLHLEHEDKVATLRLGDIKLSKRGREVIVTSREKGLGGYLGLKKELGVLEFESVGEVDAFAQRLSRALSRIACL